VTWPGTAPSYPPISPVYGWVPAYDHDPYRGWVPRYCWHPQYGWVHAFIWAPLPPGWAMPAVAGPERYGRRPHPTATPYLHLLRTPTYGWWKSVLGLLLAGLTWLVASVVILLVALLLVGGGSGSTEEFLDEIATDPLSSPGGLLVLNLTLAALIPSVWVAVLAVHGERLGWVSSVMGRLRWRLVLGFGAVATGLLLVGLFLGYLIADPVEGSGASSYDSSFVLGMLAVVLFTTPLQAAGEEYLFRGYLSQVIAGWIPARLVAVIVAGVLTGFLFALAHGSQDVPTFASRLAFGLTASLVVYLTGGLEAAIAYHAMNNVLIFLLALAVGPELEVEVSSGTVLIVDLLVMAGFVSFVAVWSRRRPVQRTTVSPGASASGGPPATRLGTPVGVG